MSSASGIPRRISEGCGTCAFSARLRRTGSASSSAGWRPQMSASKSRPAAHLTHREERARDGERNALLVRAGHERAHVCAVDELEREEEMAIHAAHVEELHDVRMAQRRGDLRLVDEHGAVAGIARKMRK